MTRAISAALYITVMLPIWLVRKTTGRSRFGRRIHRAPTGWDRLVPMHSSSLTREQAV